MVHDFFWEGAHGDMHNVNLGTFQRPQASGSLGIGNFKHRNSSFLQNEHGDFYRA